MTPTNLISERPISELLISERLISERLISERLISERLILDRAFARRIEPGRAVARQAEPLARACHAMARRFQQGGRLITFGTGAAAADAAHLSVEFVHPVVVGKRALPALCLANDAMALTAVAGAGGYPEVFAAQVRLLGRPDDIAVGLVCGNLVCGNAHAESDPVRSGLAAARDRGMLTIALIADDDDSWRGRVDHLLVARTDDPQIAKEIHVTMYHILWELVHVFLERPGVLSPTVANAAGAGMVANLNEAGIGADIVANVDPVACHETVCVTCADEALPVTVLHVASDGLALVDTGRGDPEEVSVALVDAHVGDVVLVHAKEAIAVLEADVTVLEADVTDRS